jgi:hypothetical protein
MFSHNLYKIINDDNNILIENLFYRLPKLIFRSGSSGSPKNAELDMDVAFENFLI